MVWPTHLCTQLLPNERRPHFPTRHNGSLVHPIASKSFSSTARESHISVNRRIHVQINDSCRTWNDILTICPAPFAIPRTVQRKQKIPIASLSGICLLPPFLSERQVVFRISCRKINRRRIRNRRKGTGPAGDSAELSHAPLSKHEYYCTTGHYIHAHLYRKTR